MTAAGRIALHPASPDPAVPYAHLQPVVDAERSWGNPPVGPFVNDRRSGEWVVTMKAPLHVQRLRATFVFPPTMEILEDRRVVDGNGVGVVGPTPARWADQGRSRFGRFLGVLGTLAGDSSYQPDTLDADGNVPVEAASRSFRQPRQRPCGAHRDRFVEPRPRTALPAPAAGGGGRARMGQRVGELVVLLHKAGGHLFLVLRAPAGRRAARRAVQVP